ncbi:ABC transporter substrate-binding protein [Plantibacter cousiniae (nom. nud.)]|uniref:ABC transporter substrate-binding protein n=1 Tax=Plantibacter cousiniae (nom. nud.) TaxID=199709 RepID=UPI001D2DE489|nr:ABC transporter substrate-binding protein [Plantibacter cousiniae]CAH0242483.1 Vitamin B12-binding protein [Plantibacter cousiniae]
MNLHPNRAAIGASILAAMLLVSAGCSSGSAPASTAAAATGDAYPVTVSSCGADYTYDHAPQRVLLGAPGVIDTLDALGVGDRAIGYALADLDRGEAAAHPQLTENTTDWTPAKEYLVGAAPDLFIANDEQQFSGDGAAGLDDLRTLGSGLYVLGDYCAGASAEPSVDAVYDDIDALGTIFDVPQRAKALNDELRGRVSVAAALRGDRQLTAASVTIVDGTVYALTGAGYQAVLNALDLTNVFADAGANFTQISREDVITADPDVIFVTFAGTGEEDAAIASANTLFAGSGAVGDGRVFGQDENAFQAGGVRVIGVIEQAAKDAFVD